MNYMTPIEYANLKRVQRKTVYKLLWDNKITGAERIGRQWRIPVGDHNEPS